MVSESDKTPSLAENEEQDLPKATLLTADSVPEPTIKAWKFSNLEQDEVRKEEKIRSDVLDQIRKEVAPQIREQTSLIKKQAFEEAQKKGYDEGFQQGIKAGKLEGKSQAAKEAEEVLAPQVKSLQELAEFMCTPYQQVSEQVFSQLTQIAIELARKIVEKNIEKDKKWVLEAVKKSVERLPNEVDAIEVHVHPTDKDVIEKYANKNAAKWILIADENVGSGTCIVKQNASTLVNDWREQLSELIEQAYGVSEKIASTAEDAPSSANNPNPNSEKDSGAVETE
ncbi:MAG: FliH/SctL family protein [Hydrogenovibrio sp.]|nr:FliH/SctL family protein [Hydrogenovibrio sp.]